VRHLPSVEALEVAKDLDDVKYAYSWYENAQDGAQKKRPSTATQAAPV
jgi:hypothetical protein